jgi:hypothetical protein
MKYILETNAAGALFIQSAPVFTPPNGLVIPAGQTVKASVPSARTLQNLFADTSPSLPVGFNVQTSDGNLYAKDSGGWINELTQENADTDEVSGVLLLSNIEAYDIGITW